MTRTIEQILGLTPMNQFDLVASPMRTLFIDNPPAANFHAVDARAEPDPADYGRYPDSDSAHPGREPCGRRLRPSQTESPAVKALRAGWMKKKAQIFAGKYHMPDSENPDTVNHLDWYEATGFTRPYPGEKKVLPASAFNRQAPTATS